MPDAFDHLIAEKQAELTVKSWLLERSTHLNEKASDWVQMYALALDNTELQQYIDRLDKTAHDVKVWAASSIVSFRQPCVSSETVALRHPIMPVGNGFGCGGVGVNRHQL